MGEQQGPMGDGGGRLTWVPLPGQNPDVAGWILQQRQLGGHQQGRLSIGLGPEGQGFRASITAESLTRRRLPVERQIHALEQTTRGGLEQEQLSGAGGGTTPLTGHPNRTVQAHHPFPVHRLTLQRQAAQQPGSPLAIQGGREPCPDAQGTLPEIAQQPQFVGVDVKAGGRKTADQAPITSAARHKVIRGLEPRRHPAQAAG
jgi:hypothetical protein